MTAYVIVQETIKDEAMFNDYRKDVPATLEPFGGTFVVRGGHLTIVEGEWVHPRLVVIAFPTRAAAEGWYGSPAYQKLMPLRLGSSTGNFIIVDGNA
ncbi:MAG: DUF1330 domain-containing protein [Hyphomicrobium sp.]